MKIHDRSRTMRPDASVFVPLAVLFVTAMNGPTIGEALGSTFSVLFSPGPGLVMWVVVVLLNLLLYAFFAPIFTVHILCTKNCAPDQRLVDRAMRHLNRVRPYTLFVSVLVFVAGRMAMVLLGPPTATSGRWAELPILGAEAAIAGLMVGVILSMQFERRLFEARQTIMRIGSGEGVAYSSLFSKVLLILVAIVLYMTLEAFSFAGGFLASVSAAQASLGASSSQLSGPELILHARQFKGIRENLDVFLFKLLLMSGFFAQMLWQLKRIISRPLMTILERLSSLNSPDQGGARTIDVVMNDEFAPVYRQINALIQRQQGQLEVSRRRLEQLIELAEDPIVAYDSARRIRIFNPAAEAVFGCPSGTALGRLVDDFLSEEGGTLVWRDASGRPLVLASHLSRREGDYWTTVILHDMSKQAEIEDSLRRARVEAEDASRMKSEFLANMSHELRTPLNAILGFTQLLDGDRNLTQAQRERIRVIMRSGEHLLSLINDILDISKIEAGKMELHPAVFDLPAFVGDLDDMFGQRCRKKGLSLYVETLEDLPRHVRGDLGKLRQVMINLVGNAVKFTDKGGIGILVGGGSGAVRFAVRDTGRGIPPGELELVMRPFVQASSTDHEGGTGLGLAISSRFIQMMGGRLEVQSVLGEGSVFSFTLPLEASGEAPPPEESADLDIGVDPEARIRVLVVDDQDSNRLVLREMLERVGFLVDEAADGAQAYALASSAAGPPALAFMDIKMPVMDGYEAVARFKKDPATASTRVFALTASAFSHDEARIAQAGFDGFLAKPFKQSALYRLILERGGVGAERRSREGHPAAEVDAEGLPPPPPSEWEAIGEEARRAIAEAAVINDFASLAELAGGLGGRAPALSGALRAAAASYDEAAIARLLARMEGGEGSHGR